MWDQHQKHNASHQYKNVLNHQEYNLRMAQGMKCCYLELHEEGEVEISTCIWHKYKDMTAILKKSTHDKIIEK